MIERFKSFLINVNFLACLASLFICRLVIFGATIGDAIALFAIGGMYSYSSFLKTKVKPSTDVDLKREIDELKNAIVMIKMKNGIKGTSEKPERYF